MTVEQKKAQIREQIENKQTVVDEIEAEIKKRFKEVQDMSVGDTKRHEFETWAADRRKEQSYAKASVTKLSNELKDLGERYAKR